MYLQNRLTDIDAYILTCNLQLPKVKWEEGWNRSLGFIYNTAIYSIDN